jgi:glycosyltransferase involved in cell wall biosynthesis
MRIWLASMGMGVGGAERVVLALAEGLIARGHAVAVSGPGGPFEPELARLPVERLLLPERGRSPRGVAEATARLAIALRRWRPDVVHAHNVRVAVTAGAAARLARGPRRPPVVATFHGVRHEEQWAASVALRAADAVVCVSEDLAEGLRGRGFPPQRLRVVANAVAAPPTVTPEARAAVDRELGLADGAPVVAAVGRLVPQKNHARLLEAVALLAREHPRVIAVIVGDGPLRAELEARAAALGVRDRVRFTGMRTDAAAIAQRADMVAFSSDWEGLSIAALEALAAGTPVVSTPVEGMVDLLAGGAGLVVGEASPAALAEGIAALAGDADLRRRMGEHGRALVAERFSLERMLDAHEELYRRL